MFIFKISWLIFALIVSAMDFSIKRVSNYGVVIVTFLGLLMLFFQKNPWEPKWINSISAFFVFLIVFLPFYKKGLMGAGDIKFMAVMGLWLGFSAYAIFAFVGGSFLAFLHSIFVIYKRKFEITKRSIPYAGYMAVSSVVGMFYLSAA